ncbi:MAG: hypothetical protein WDO13_10130 [Verrucomicrobiota bacterium]
MIQSTGGWALVGIALLLAAALPVITIAAAQVVAGRGLTTDPAVHWTERARRSYAFQLALGTCLLFLSRRSTPRAC